MNEYGTTDWNEISYLIRWHGYACVIPEAVTGSALIGKGCGAWQALVNAGGEKLANAICDAELNGGRQSTEFTRATDESLVFVSTIENSDGEPLAYFFK